MIYLILGLVVSAALIVGGVVYEATIATIAGVVMLICTIGNFIGSRTNKNQ